MSSYGQNERNTGNVEEDRDGQLRGYLHMTKELIRWAEPISCLPGFKARERTRTKERKKWYCNA
jgi:hypothetical protein